MRDSRLRFGSHLLLLIVFAAVGGPFSPPIPVDAQALEPAPSAGATPLSPDEAVRLGLERSVRLRAAEADIDEARAVLGEARAARFPTVDALASYTRLTDNVPEVDFQFPGLDTTFTILPVELNRYHSEIKIEQPIFTGFAIRNQIRAAAHQADAAEAIRTQEEADLAFEIRSAYWRLAQATEILDALDAALTSVEEHVRVTEARVDEERALRRDLLAAQTRRSEVMLERLEAENAVRLAQLELNRLVGLPLDARTLAEAPLDVEPPAADLETITTATLNARPQLRAMEDQIEALEVRADISRGGWLPNLFAVGRYVYARPNPYFFAEQGEFKGTGEIGLSLQWNLFEGGRRMAQTRQAEARVDAAEAQLAEAREQVAVEVARRYLELQRAIEAVGVAEQHMEEARESYRVVREQFAEEAALTADVLEAERAAREAEARRWQARSDYGIARAALLNVQGRVW